MKFLTKVIAAAVMVVVDEIAKQKEAENALTRMHDFCDASGYVVTEVMQKDPKRFMEAFDKAAAQGPVEIKYQDFPVEFNRAGRKTRTDWIQCENHISVHSGARGF